MLSAKFVKNTLWIAVVVRVFSQVVWSMADQNANLQMTETLFALLAAPLIWLELEVPKLLTCVVVAMLILGWHRWISTKRFGSWSRNIAITAVVLISASYSHGLLWVFLDCEFMYDRAADTHECLQRVSELNLSW